MLLLKHATAKTTIKKPLQKPHYTHTQRNIFEILLNQIEIRLCLAFYDRFGTKWMSDWLQINRKMVNTIWYRFDMIRFRKDFSVCTYIQKRLYSGARNEGLAVVYLLLYKHKNKPSSLYICISFRCKCRPFPCTHHHSIAYASNLHFLRCVYIKTF